MVDLAQITPIDCTHKYVAVISGASRGIGLEFVRQVSQRSNSITIAVVRPSSDLTQLQQLHNITHNICTVYCELNDSSSVRAACQQIQSMITHISLLVNCAGYAGTRNYEDKALSIDLTDMLTVFNINTVAQLQIIQLLHPLLVQSYIQQKQHAVVLNISSRTASIQNAITVGGCASYRISKIALNMISAELTNECKQCIYLSVSPGHVQTEMGRLSGRKPTLTVTDSVHGMLSVAETVKLDDSGKFYNYDGTIIQY